MAQITLSQLIRFCVCPRKFYFSASQSAPGADKGGTPGFTGELFFRELALPLFRRLSSKGWNRLKNEAVTALESPAQDRPALFFASLRRHLLDPLLQRESQNLTSDRLVSLATCARMLCEKTMEFMHPPEPFDAATALKTLGRLVVNPDEDLTFVWVPQSGPDLVITGSPGLLILNPDENRVRLIWIADDADQDLRRTARRAGPFAWLAAKSLNMDPSAEVIYLKPGLRPFLSISGGQLEMGWRDTEAALPKLARLVQAMETGRRHPPPPFFVFPGRPCADCGFEPACRELG